MAKNRQVLWTSAWPVSTERWLPEPTAKLALPAIEIGFKSGLVLVASLKLTAAFVPMDVG